MRQPPRPTPITLAVITVIAASVLGACDTGDGRTLEDPTFSLPATVPPVVDDTLPPESVSAFQLILPWQDGAEIPARHTCDDVDVSPAVAWSGAPFDAVELALTVTDPDAGGFVHWVIAGLDPAEPSLLEGDVPPGARTWANSFGDDGWSGPCPPLGDTHEYRFTLYALNQQVEAADDAPASEVLALLEMTQIVQSSVSGTYARTG